MRSSGRMERIVIIGGGISGLSSAFYLQREAAKRGRQTDITIVDGLPRLGGKIETLAKDGFVIEKGPDSFLARKLPIIELTRELGLEDELTTTNPDAKHTYIFREGTMHPMPPGLMLGIPTDVESFLKSELISFGGKLRATMDLLLPPRKEQGDESLGGFLERRLGPEMVDRVAEPLLAGIYAGNLRELSLRATFPQFQKAEQEHGSLIRGMRRLRGNATPAAAVVPSADSLQPEDRSSGQSARAAEAGKSVFITYKNGLGTLVDGLDRALADVTRKLGVNVTQIRPGAGAGGGARYSVMLDSGETLAADGIIVTAPAFNAADLLEEWTDVSALRAVRYVSVANVVMAFEKTALGLEFDGSGFLVPRSEGMNITACTWTSAKWLHTSPQDKVLLRCYVGRAGTEQVVDLPDDELIASVRCDVQETMGITAEPLFTEITRLHRSMPQYPVGHTESTAAFRSMLQERLPGVWVTGAAFDGVGLPDCIRQGKEAAAALLDMLEAVVH
ncbi:protoporphyrinogen oxidase [Paenibacillus beijingensis]|uniref:Coproporphyrinogen III oxidase n=1 Tax=Paenibacillus beijingensis TaxID=1126833 RepID=A0A0D5NEP3_9BACL|nr:protoporphyrinogen oxidase [Paenibacillus beijingensis]AJY73393.1 protoporphyrinogen oxidase [Paenibacillus beijingensis]